ncbi:hypothetical protein, partial [Gulosibacter bifidus]
PAAQVRAYWESLDAGRQQHLIREFPETIGNLSGVPFAVRAQANKRTAQNYIDRIGSEHPNIDQEITELETKKNQRIVELGSDNAGYNNDYDAKIQELREIRANLDAAETIINGREAILFDPNNDRIITVSGDFNTSVDYAAIFVPGTDTGMKSFSNGISDFGDSLVDELDAKGQNAVVFTIKDGSWSTWGGEGANSSENEMAERAEKVQRLAEDLRLEDFSPSTEYIGIGHSAGVPKLCISETEGAVYDEVISSGGAYVGHKWRPSPLTDYTHFQYSNDFINALDYVGYRTPNILSAFDKVYIDSPTGNMLDDHSRISQGSKTNRLGIVAISHEIIQD